MKRTKLKKKRNPDHDPNQKIRFERKREFLAKHGGRGEDYPDKPWLK